MLALLAGGLTAWQHFNTVSSQKNDLRDLRTQISQAQARLDRKKADIESLGTKVSTAQAVIDREQEKKRLAGEISQLEGQRSTAQQKLADTLAQVRTAALGADWPDLMLPNGQTITGVKIQKCTDTDVSLSHSGGVAKVQAKDLPDDLKSRLGYGVAGPGAP